MDISNERKCREKRWPGERRRVKTNLIDFTGGSNKREDICEAIINWQEKQGKTDKSVTQQKKELCQNWIVRPFHSDTQPIWLCFNSSWVCWVSGPGSSSSEKPQMSPPELPLGRKLPSGNSFRSLQEHKHLPVQLQSLNFCSERAHQEQAKGTEPPSKYLFLHSSLS